MAAKHRTTSALFYPLTVLIVALAMVLFLSIYVVPKFENILMANGPGQQLPALTRGMISFSAFLRSYITQLFLCFVGIFGCIIYSLHTWRGRIFWSRFALSFPFFGKLLLMQNLAIFLRTFGLLLEHAVPFTEALHMASQAIANEAMKTHYQHFVERVRNGESLTDLLHHSPHMIPFILGLIAVGEESGRLSAMLLQGAHTLTEELDRAMERIAAILQPLIVLILASVVAIIAAAMFLPMTQMLQLQNI
jgi:type II secretory pathway component PulF